MIIYFLIREENYQSETHLDTIYRMPDRIGNLYGTPDRKDRKYGAGGRLEEDEDHFYHYDDEGNLIYKELRTLQDGVVNYRRKEEEQELNIKFRSTGTGWRYDWQSNGMLKQVIRPDEKVVHFRYDALGRRTAKVFKGTVTRWIWDGNVPLHEWEYKAKVLQVPLVEGDKQQSPVEPTEDVTSWVFEAGTFVPAAKIKGDKRYSIVTDYLGTPIQMYDEQGEKTWDCTLDVYGKVANFEGSSLKECPFRYQGQYEDRETGLYYNRFRYYEPEVGRYLSRDPIGLRGGSKLYGYVHDTNTWIDEFGLHRNGHLAENSHPITGVPFDSKGFPDFADYLYSEGKNDVMITPTGNRERDFNAANAKAGYDETPKGYTWHHHQDKGRMQLVETEIHAKTGHTGGFSLHSH